eukprot:1188370-Amphidinium_carterae.1
MEEAVGRPDVDFASMHDEIPPVLRLGPVALSRIHDCSRGDATAPTGCKLKMQKRPIRPLETTLTSRQGLRQSASSPTFAIPRPVKNFISHHDRRRRVVEREEMGPAAHGADALGKSNWQELLSH